MTRCTTYRALALGLSLAIPAVSGAEDAAPAATARPKARLYTNEDLERVHPLAAETGVLSVPAVTEEPARSRGTKGPHDRESRSNRQGEAYWRSEAERVREKRRALEERAAALRARIEERSRQGDSQVFGRRGSSSSSSRGSSLLSLQSSLAAVERRARLLEEDLSERARKAGALPGWLR